MRRRTFLAAMAASRRAPRVLLRSSWQSVNIGDIGHTPGALGILRQYFPEAQVTLWPGELGHGARELLERGFPEVKIVEGSLGRDGKPREPGLAAAWAETDVYVSGSGSGFPRYQDAEAFRRATGKPVGVLGVSLDPVSGVGDGRDPEGGTLASLRDRALALPANHLSGSLRYVIDESSFFFCRDTITRDYLKAQGVKTPVLEFGPDAQLGMRLRDETRGEAWLRERGLRQGEFICVIPRLRYTPYYRIRKAPRVAADDVKDAINARTTERDHAKAREMMAAYVRQRGRRVVVCAEMTYQVEMGKEVLVDPLPEDVKRNVLWRDTYWLPDEAASVYARAEAVVSYECHSPLIALRAGTPAFYLRQPTDTCKGQMYRDFGAGDWLFEIDETKGSDLWERLRTVVARPDRARARVEGIMAEVERRQRRMAEAVRRAATQGSLG